MKTLFRNSLPAITVSVLLLAVTVVTVKAQSATLQIDRLDSLANKASETVDVKLDEHLMQMTAKFFVSKDPDDGETRELIKGVKGIHVKSFTFEKEGEYSPAEIDSVMSQLRGGAWSKIIGVTRRRMAI